METSKQNQERSIFPPEWWFSALSRHYPGKLLAFLPTRSYPRSVKSETLGVVTRQQLFFFFFKASWVVLKLLGIFPGALKSSGTKVLYVSA